ncbi:hypothetical protein CAPTEDRAFT_156921 [Capitella teleta]|uniref:Small ribosomal subunit protein uS5m n=1 Tax=Capitella teleta TaxID=283909 RepID=R7V275_CAPTE|nr:hypothetical protein CAPTEDRAFT_156921 [Capitella teleta]|eukprot:ELU12582.1 hypothetical protein CAPTEDRAFT_156921 [Capitella teleta]
MAASLRVVCSKSFQFNSLNYAVCRGLSNLSISRTSGLLIPSEPQKPQPQRQLGFLTELNQESLWGGVTGVSNAGRKRGRAKRVGRAQDINLNKGRPLGSGRDNILWPGLNTPVLKHSVINKISQVPVNPERDERLAKIREQHSGFKRSAPPPLVRGWTGARMGGKSIGQPEAVGDYEFEGFDSRVLEIRMVANMTGTIGRKRRFSSFICVGNGNGIAGFGSGKSKNMAAAMRVGKNRAAQNLMYIPLFEGHTVYHDMFVKYHKSKIFIHKKEKGYGLKCHRALKTLCQMIGIKDLHVRVEGSTKNIRAITKGFFDALNNQENHQDLANRTGYHIVERRKERDYFPTVVASPVDREVKQERMTNEEEDIELDYERLYHGGRSEYKHPPRKQFYEKTVGWRRRYAREHKARNQRHLTLLKLSGLVPKHFPSTQNSAAAVASDAN